MATTLSKVNISPKNAALPTKTLAGINRDGEIDEGVDFFKDTLRGDWWDFLENTSIPQYYEEDVVYSIAIKSHYTCTGDLSTLESRKQEYLKSALEHIFTYYNKDYDGDLINKFAQDTGEDGKQISRIVDYHIRPRPSEKLKFLVEVNARYFNAVPSAPLPASFVNNLDEDGNLIVVDGLLNPTNGNSYEDISIVTLHSDAYEREILKVASHMVIHHRNILVDGYKIKNLNLYKEADRMLSLPAIINTLVSKNYASNGVGAGYGSNNNLSPEPPYLTESPYKINFAFRTKDDETGELEILWASVNDGSSDLYLNAGFKRFLDTHPISHTTVLHYFYWHQQILNNLDRNIELNHVDFVKAYNYPKIDFSKVISDTKKDIPFGDDTDEDSPGSDNVLARPPSVKCGRKKHDFDFAPPSFADMLRQAFEPLNYDLASINITFFSLGPPCPADPTGRGPAVILDERLERLKDRIRRDKKAWDEMWKEGESEADFVGDYYTSEEFVNDLEKRFNSGEMKLRKLGDMILNNFGLDKMLQLVCICITQIADKALVEEGWTPQVPEAGISIKGPGASFDPSILIDQLADDDPYFDIAEAFEGSLGSMNPPFGEWPAEMKRYKLEQLCSMCIHMPDILYKLPTFDLLKAVIKAILNLLEMLIVQMLMALVLQLLKWLTKCPDYECDIRPRGAAIDDFGSNSLGDLLLPDAFTCGVFEDLEEEGVNVDFLKQSLLERISAELSTGEMANVLEGYPTRTAVYVIKDIIHYETEFEDIRPYFISEASVEDLIGCISDAADPYAMRELDSEITSPDYCPSPDNTPSNYMKEKCNNDEETEKFLLREKIGKAARLRGIVDAIRNNPNFMGELLPPVFSSRNPDGTKNPGLLSDPKLKPQVADTMIDTVVDPMVDSINRASRRDGPSFLKSLYHPDPSSSTRVKMTDTMKEVFSIAQLASSVAIIPFAAPVAAALAPMSFDKDIDTKYPAVGGLELHKRLQSLEAYTNIYWAVSEDSDKNGLDIGAQYSGIPNSANRKFNQRIVLNLPKTKMRVYLETISDTLLETDEQYKGFQNHIMVKIQSPEDPEIVYPSFWDHLSPTHPYKAWFEKNNAPLFDDKNFSFSYKVPMKSLDEKDLVIPAEYSIPGVVDTPYAYSPQGKVFAKLITDGLGSVYDAMGTGAQGQLTTTLESKVHLYALRDFIEKVGTAASKSPYFRTYTYEEISSKKHGLKFEHLHREDPYSNFGATPFKQKYSAKDKSGRTKVYFEPSPALEDTPLRKGAVELIRVEETKQRIKDAWDWSEQYDPADVNSLSPLSVAVIDGLVEELIRTYCVEALIKAAPATNAFDTYVQEVRDKMFSTVISKLIVRDLPVTYDEEFVSVLLEYIDSYWERKYLSEGKSANDSPKGDDAIEALVEEMMESAIPTAKQAMTLYHLQEVPATDPLEFVTVPNPEPFSPAINAPPMETFHVAEIIENDASGIPKVDVRLTAPGLGDLTNGAFIYERYVKLELHTHMKTWLKANGIDINQFEGPLSLKEAQENDISDPDFEPTTAFAGLIKLLYKNITIPNSPLQASSVNSVEYNVWNKIKNAKKIVGSDGIFKNLTHHMRLSFVITGKDTLEDYFGQILNDESLFTALAGGGMPLRDAIIREKSFLMEEDGNKVIVLPIAETQGSGLPSLKDEIGEEYLTNILDTENPWVAEAVIKKSGGISGVAPDLVEGDLTLHPVFWPMEHLRYLMSEIQLNEPQGASYIAMFNGKPSEDDNNAVGAPIFYPVPDETPWGSLDTDIPGSVTFKGGGQFNPNILDEAGNPKKNVKTYSVDYNDLPADHQNALLSQYWSSVQSGGGAGGNKTVTYYIEPPPTTGKEDGIDVSAAYKPIGLPDSPPESEVTALLNIKNSTKFKLLFSYALPESVATNIVSLYTYLGILEEPRSRRSFGRTKMAFKFAIDAAANRADMSGKPKRGANSDDLVAFTADDEPPDYEYSLPEGEEASPDDNLTLLYQMGELTKEQVNDISPD